MGSGKRGIATAGLQELGEMIEDFTKRSKVFVLVGWLWAYGI
jgi:hypothetical protein